MKRFFPRMESEAVALASLLALAIAAGSACEPDNKVKAGAPVLLSLSILEASGTRTDVTSMTTDCPAGDAEGDDCDPSAAACRLSATICHCAAKPEGDCSIDPDEATTGGTWICHYGPQATVLAVFDRLLDTATLGPGNEGPPPTNVVSLMAMPVPAMTVAAATTYVPNGAVDGLVFPAFFGTPVGPSFVVAADPATPTSSNLKFTLDNTKVRAKDGKTPFTAAGFLVGGAIAFDTNPFGVGISVPVFTPPPPDPDAGTDAGTDDGGTDGGVDDGGGAADGGGTSDAAAEAGVSDDGGDGGMVCVPPPPPAAPDPVPPNADPVTVSFNNPVDVDAIVAHIHLTAGIGGTAIPAADLMFDTTMGPTTVVITPTATWPASTTIVITVDATASDVLGATLGTDQSASFTTTSGM